MMQQAQEQAAAQARQAQEQAAGTRVVEAGEGSGVVEEDAEAARPTSAAQPSPRDKRPRATKSSAMLVRPPTAVESAADLEASASRDLPEERIARDTAAPMDGIIAETGARLNGGAAQPNIAAAGAGGASKQAPRTGGANHSGSQKKGQQPRRKGQKGGR
jgi:hypothetical protein